MKLYRLIRDIALSIEYPPKIFEKIVVNIKCPQGMRIKCYTYYRKYIFKKLNHLLNSTFNIIKADKISTLTNNNGPIWMFWWQGTNHMPVIVKYCIKSVKRHSNGHKVIIINRENIMRYATIPKYIYDKLHHHDMTLTHFSDVLRFNLLYNYGGLWIDSTVYCTSDLSDKYFNNIYTAGGYNFQQCGKLLFSKWTEFLIGGNAHNDLFRFMNEFFNLYWKNHKYLIDYLLVDYGIAYAYLHGIDGFKCYVDTQANKNNPHLYSLVEHLNNKYNNTIFRRMTNDTNLFKLTYKTRFNSNGDTFYNRLIHNIL